MAQQGYTTVQEMLQAWHDAKQQDFLRQQQQALAQNWSLLQEQGQRQMPAQQQQALANAQLLQQAQAQQHTSRYSLIDQLKNIPTFDPLRRPLTVPPPLTETPQEPRQWNLTTIKRCRVTREEYQYWGCIEEVLRQKGFPSTTPEDGTILLSWFDQAEGAAYYELARAQDPGELARYMLDHFQPAQPSGVERVIEFPEEHSDDRG